MLSVVIKNKYFELECYNKEHESEKNDYSKSRLEFRCKSLYINDINDVPDVILNDWNNRINKVWMFSRLEKEWIKTLKKQYDKRTSEIDADKFVYEKKDEIYSKRMLKDIIAYIKDTNDYSGVRNVLGKTNYLKRKYKIEFYDVNDISCALTYWLLEIESFFKNSVK